MFLAAACLSVCRFCAAHRREIEDTLEQAIHVEKQRLRKYEHALARKVPGLVPVDPAWAMRLEKVPPLVVHIAADRCRVLKHLL